MAGHDAEYVALALLQADSLVTLDELRSAAASTKVRVARVDGPLL